ncbi:helix-turn-helix transcriptional regulator [Pseudoneobacillus rhizosphaerae]|nr:winged helix-turn-helix transcriptional regulator [Pseudoneobacillus rhizosphaerae]
MLPNSISTKEKILNHIKANIQMTVLELSAQLNITEMAVRRHLQVLETDGLLSSFMKKNMTGRPSKVFQLSELGEDFFPKQYKQIGMDLLQEINRLDASIINQAIVSRQERLVNRYRGRFKDKPFIGQINELAKIQSEMGFMAEVNETDSEEVAQIRQSNCPYLEIAKDFPEICRNEHKFYEELLHTKNIEKISSLSRGDSCCHYVIRKD